MVHTVTFPNFWPANAYFYVDDVTHSGFLIDPGAGAGKLMHIINEHAFNVEKILLTHGHYDHIGAAAALRAQLNVPIVMHVNGEKYVTNPDWNLSTNFGSTITLSGVNYVDDGAEIVSEVDGNLRLKVIAVPGHTTDSVTYYSERDGLAFVGDTIFKASFGRTDLVGGNEWELFESIRNRIFSLPDSTVLYSGHTEPTTVADEKTRPWYSA